MKKYYNNVIVIVPVYNAEKLIEKCINSILSQTYKDFIIIIRDDISTDNTVKIVEEKFGDNDKIVLVKNDKKLYPCGNIYESVIDYVGYDHSIIVTVDGDDELIDMDAFRQIVDVYEKHDKWLVWSQHVTASGQRGQSKPLPNNEYIITSRQYWSVSHLRTAKAFLYKKIDRNDLLDYHDKSTYMKFAGDAALLFPMIEMSLNEKSQFIDKNYYKYNDNLALNETRVNMSMAVYYGSRIKSEGKRYKKLHDYELPSKHDNNTTNINPDLMGEYIDLKKKFDEIKTNENLLKFRLNQMQNKIRTQGWKLY